MVRAKKDSTAAKPTNLAVDCSVARERIKKQLARGREIRDIVVTSQEELSRAKSERIKWIDYTTDLLRRLFDTPVPAEEFGASVRHIFVLGASPEEEVRDFRFDMDTSIMRLESLLERLDLMDEPRAASVPPAAAAPSRYLRVFLCHGREDKPTVRALYQRLREEGDIDPWLDTEKLLPGQNWEYEIRKAIRATAVVVVCLSLTSVGKSGYVQKEITLALDEADKQPEGTIYIIPGRLDDCRVPDRLSHCQWVDLFEPDGYERLLQALRARADSLPSCQNAFQEQKEDGTIMVERVEAIPDDAE